MTIRMPRRWEAHFLRNEAVAATAVALLLAVWSERGGGGPWLWAGLDANRPVVYSTAASLAGAFLGFVLATLAIVSGLNSLPSFRRLRSSSQYPTLWAVFKLTLRVLAAIVGVSLVGLVADRDSAPLHWLFYLMTWLVLWGSTLTARTIWVLERVLAIAPASEG